MADIIWQPYGDYLDKSNIGRFMKAHGIKTYVVEVMGKPFKPEEIEFVKQLPKTRSGKILRGLIKKKYLDQEIGDISSVENPDAINEIARRPNANTTGGNS